MLCRIQVVSQNSSGAQHTGRCEGVRIEGRIGRGAGPRAAEVQGSRDLLEVVLTHLLVAGISTHALDASIGKVLTWVKEL